MVVLQAPDDLKQFASIGLLVERCQDPMAMIPPTEEEQRLLASNVNSNAAYGYVFSYHIHFIFLPFFAINFLVTIMNDALYS